MKKRVSELYYETLGEKFDEYISPFDVEQRMKLIQKMLPLNSKQMKCIEFGCGTGRITDFILYSVKDLTVSDISSSLAQSVGGKFGISWRSDDVCNLSIADKTYDLVISSECIEHTPNPKLALQHMARILKPGGFLIFTTPNKLWYPVLLLAQFLNLRKFKGNEVWLFPYQARNVLTKMNFHIERIGGCHLFPWQLPFSKKILPYFNYSDQYLYPVMINFGILARKQHER